MLSCVVIFGGKYCYASRPLIASSDKATKPKITPTMKAGMSHKQEIDSIIYRNLVVTRML